jgi:hypothetical protein
MLTAPPTTPLRPWDPTKPRKGDILIEALERCGVYDAFTYPDGASMEIHQAQSPAPLSLPTTSSAMNKGRPSLPPASRAPRAVSASASPPLTPAPPTKSSRSPTRAARLRPHGHHHGTGVAAHDWHRRLLGDTRRQPCCRGRCSA